ncbi:MAG TPA: SURF1 family protein [Anaerolineales bacterium]|nr:SURF1 family protein [Anaerolineales bacterium]
MNFFLLVFSRRWWWTSLIVLAAIGVTIRLGIWQLDRNAQRQALIRQVLAVQAMPVLDLTQRPLPSNLETFEFRRVTVSGQYDFNHQVVLRNQVRVLDLGNESGFALVTPLLMADGTAIMVERGWIPLQYDTPSSWRQFDEPGMMRLEGILRLSMQKGELGNLLQDPTLTPSQASLNTWNFINLPRLQLQIPYPILSIYIQQVPVATQGTLPYRLVEQPDLDPGEHIGFAMQWFFFCALLVVGYPIWLKKQNKQ